jgi:hypothetical protein
MEAAILDDVVECSTISSFMYSHFQEESVCSVHTKECRYLKCKYVLNMIKVKNKMEDVIKVNLKNTT